ncbi:MAG TPA: AMP-binding protein [Gaiellaceae bacterium]|nr:AMP-binding protein [Gaiellaceae bacterium]
MTARFTESYWPADVRTELVELTVGGLLREAAAEVPEGVALVAGVPVAAERRRWTYAELLADSERTARALAGRFAPGERVAVWAPNVPEWLLLEFGAALAGLTLVTVNPALRRDEVRHVLSQSRCSGVLFTEEFRGNPMRETIAGLLGELPLIREAVGLSGFETFLAGGDATAVLADVFPSDPVQIQYTSGTTGVPKGALLHHRGIVNNARFVVDRAGFEDGGVWVDPMPLFHTAGCVLSALGALWRRGTHVLVPAFDPALVLELLEAERGTILIGVPTMLIAVLDHPDFPRRDLSSVNAALSGGAPVPAELVRRVESSLGCPFSIVFGQTELAPTVTQTRLEDTPADQAETIGQPLPHVEVKVADPVTGAVLPIGEQGEICARGYQVMLGYFDMPEATAETIDADGWLHTGDLGTMDERGYFRVTGRLKDMIIRGGENIYPREIEDLLFTHPAVAEAAVLGIPDALWGEQVGVVIRAADPGRPPTPGELHDFCRAHLAPQKTPTLWYLADAFPLTASGKIQKFVLRERAAAGELPRLQEPVSP